MEKDNNKKLCCYLMACSDLICFVGGSLLLSLAIFGSACTGAACAGCCGCLTYLGLPLIALGFVLRCWCCGCCGNKCRRAKGSSCDDNLDQKIEA
jgi:urea transporter